MLLYQYVKPSRISPSVYEYLTNEGFTTALSGLQFSKIPCDQITETTIN